MKTTAVAATALALLVATSASAARTPTRLWYKLSIVYIGTQTGESISNGAKSNLELHSAFTGKSDTAVLVRKDARGRFTIRNSKFTGTLSRLDWDYKQDWFVGTVAPCKEHTHESIVQPAALEGVFGAEPMYRGGRTGFGASVSTTARTKVERFAVAPCAGSIRNRPVELLNQDAVNRGEPPQFLVKGSVDDDVETEPVAMLRIPSNNQKTPEGRTLGKFGQQSFSIISHLVVRYGPRYVGGVIDSYSVDESWFFSFTRCPGTAPCS